MASAKANEDDIWFLATRVTVRVSFEDSPNGISVLEHRASQGDSPPLHRHRDEDEIFHIIEGELEFRLGDADRVEGPGAVVLVPKQVPHTYRVASTAARWLTITTGKDFERFVRTLGRTPDRAGLPDAAGPPTAEKMQQLVEVAGRHGIDIIGPPLGAT